MGGRKILKRRGRELVYKLIITPFYHIRYFLSYGIWDFTNEISIGISSYCNLRCNNCPNSVHENSLKKNEVLMKENLFYKIIEDLKKINYRGRLGFHFFSEPLGDERLAKFVKYARSQLPKVKIVISSNGFLLTLEKYKELVENGVREFTITQYSNEIPKNLPEILQYDKEHGNYIDFRRFTDDMRESFAGEVEGNILEKPICTYPSNILMVNSKGEIVCCCNDYHSSIVWGDLNKEGLLDIFNKKSFKKFRKDVKKKIFVYPICKKCRGIE
jgi:radical SAM protein with 4Fe4S-binding SPASM domain